MARLPPIPPPPSSMPCGVALAQTPVPPRARPSRARPPLAPRAARIPPPHPADEWADVALVPMSTLSPFPPFAGERGASPWLPSGVDTPPIHAFGPGEREPPRAPPVRVRGVDLVTESERLARRLHTLREAQEIPLDRGREMAKALPSAEWLRAARRTPAELEDAARDLGHIEQSVAEYEAQAARRAALRDATKTGSIEVAAGVRRDGSSVSVWATTLDLVREVGTRVLWADRSRVDADNSMIEPVVAVVHGQRRAQWRVAFYDVPTARAVLLAADAALHRPGVIVHPIQEEDPLAGTVPLPPAFEPPVKAPEAPRLPPYGVFLLRVPAATWQRIDAGKRAKLANNVRAKKEMIDDGQGMQFGPLLGVSADALASSLRTLVRDPVAYLEDVTAQWDVLGGLVKETLAELNIPYLNAPDGRDSLVRLVAKGIPQAYAEALGKAVNASVFTPDGKEWPLASAEPAEMRVPRTEFEIPIENLPAFEKRMAMLIAKAAKVKQDAPSFAKVGEPFSKQVDVQVEKLNPNGEGTVLVTVRRPYLVQRVRVEGLAPRLRGWDVIGILEPTATGENKVYAVGRFPLSMKYRNTGVRCDHCHLIRARAKVVVLRNDAEGRELQVGLACLKDFTGHDSPEAVAAFAEMIYAALGEFDELGDFGRGGGKHGYDLPAFLAHVAELVLRYGFASKNAVEQGKARITTADLTTLWMDGNGKNLAAILGFPPWTPPSPAAVELGQNSLAWAQAIPAGQNDRYLNNLRVTSREDAVYRNGLGLAASIVPAYQRAYGQMQERKAQEAALKRPAAHVGKVGEGWEGCVVVFFTLATEDSSLIVGNTLEPGTGTPTPDVVSWWRRDTMTPPPEKGTIVKVRGTVKEHRFREDKRTQEQRPESSLTRVTARWWPLFLGRQPWQMTRAEWDSNPLVVGWRSRAKIEAEVPWSLSPSAWAARQGLPPDPDRPETNEWWSPHKEAARALYDREYKAWAAANEAQHRMYEEELARLDVWLAQHGVPAGREMLPTDNEPLLDHGQVVREAYEMGFPVPGAVLADYSTMVAEVAAAREAVAREAAAKEARKRKKGEAATPDTPDARALGGPYGAFLRDVLARRTAGEAAFFAVRNRVAPPVKIGATTVDTETFYEASSPPSSPTLTSEHPNGRAAYDAEPRRVALFPKGLTLQVATPMRQGFKWTTAQEAPYDDAAPAKAAAWLLFEAVPPSPRDAASWGDGGDAAFAAAQVALDDALQYLREAVFFDYSQLSERAKLKLSAAEIEEMARKQHEYAAQLIAGQFADYERGRHREDLNRTHFLPYVITLVKAAAHTDATFVTRASVALRETLRPLAKVSPSSAAQIDGWFAGPWFERVVRAQTDALLQAQIAALNAFLAARGIAHVETADRRALFLAQALGEEIARARGHLEAVARDPAPAATARVASLYALHDWLARVASKRDPSIALLAQELLLGYAQGRDPDGWAMSTFVASFGPLVATYRKRLKTKPSA